MLVKQFELIQIVLDLEVLRNNLFKIVQLFNKAKAKLTLKIACMIVIYVS